MISDAIQPIKIGISSCLLGESVRFDSGHKKNAYITDILGEYFEFRPFCPEVAIGLGIPREPVRLVSAEGEIRCVGTKTPDIDITDQLKNISDQQKHWHAEMCGYILKKDSPSCGMERVRVYNSKGIPERSGTGLYAGRILANFPFLPVEEEGRLADARLRENFIQRVYVYSRWKELQCEGFTVAGLQEFHARHKYIFMSHDQNRGRELGKLLASATDSGLKELADHYLEKMMTLLRQIATISNHVNTLQHVQGYLKNSIDADDKAELSSVIDDYRKGLLPLIVPVTLLRHHFRKFPDPYILNSYYLSPHPGELMLLNHI